MRRILRLCYDAAGYAAAFFVCAIFVVMIGASIMREFGLKTGGTDDLVAWMCAAAAFLAMAHTFKHGDFVRVTLLLERLNAGQRRAFEIGGLLVAIVFISVLTYAACHFVYESWAFNDMANGLIAIPLWIPQSSFVVGAVLLLIAVIEEFVNVLAGRTPDYEQAIAERRARGDYSEEL